MRMGEPPQRYMGEEECSNGATDFLVVGGGVLCLATLIVIAVSYFAGGCGLFLIDLLTMLPNLMLIVIKGGNLKPGSFFSPPFLFFKSCLLLVIASTEIWVCMKSTFSLHLKSPSDLRPRKLPFQPRKQCKLDSFCVLSFLRSIKNKEALTSKTLAFRKNSITIQMTGHSCGFWQIP